MRTKLFILLALFVAFSSASFAQVDFDDDHIVTVDLTENREVEIAGLIAPTLEIARLAPVDLADPLNWEPNTDASLDIFHDLGLDQKIVVEAAITSGDWADRYLSVEADDAALTTGGTSAGAVMLISGGSSTGPKDLITAIADMTAAGTENAPLEYRAAAGLNATPGIHTSTVTYTMMDE